MVWQTQVHIYCSLETCILFNEAQFIQDFERVNACKVDARKEVRDDHIILTIIFPNEDVHMEPLDSGMLTQIISDHLGEQVRIRVDAGGFGTLSAPR
jgi:hypothetical protein